MRNNHVRIVAASTVHLRQVHWHGGAQWMLAHLLMYDLSKPPELVGGRTASRRRTCSTPTIAALVRAPPPHGTAWARWIDTSYEVLDRSRTARHRCPCPLQGRTDVAGTMPPSSTASPITVRGCLKAMKSGAGDVQFLHLGLPGRCPATRWPTPCWSVSGALKPRRRKPVLPPLAICHRRPAGEDPNGCGSASELAAALVRPVRWAGNLTLHQPEGCSGSRPAAGRAAAPAVAVQPEEALFARVMPR